MNDAKFHSRKLRYKYNIFPIFQRQVLLNKFYINNVKYYFSSSSDESCQSTPLTPIKASSCLTPAPSRLPSASTPSPIVLFILPLCILVLFVGHQRWRQRCPGATLSHFDILTYHLVAIEILNVIVAILNCWISYAYLPSLWIALQATFSVTFPGQLIYQCLTSIDRYLAVVHPIIYLRLRNRNAVKIIYISSGFACCCALQ